MRKSVSALLVLITLFVLPSCSEKFNVAAPYKNITVIYGLLDRADTAHYIRVEKAFMDENKSALTMAKVADSSFFPHINVMVKKISLFDTTRFDTIHLNRVDLTAEGYPKQAGVFFDAPNYAYKFTNDLDPNYIYRLIVHNDASGETDSADAPVIDDKNKTNFQVYILDDTTITAPPLEFSSTQSNASVKLAGVYNAPGNFSFQGQSTPVGVCQGVLRIRWTDRDASNSTRTQHYYDFNLGYGALTNSSFLFDVKDLAIYNAINVGMGKPANDFTDRLIDRCELFVYLGTFDFNTYIQRQSLQGSGLTGNEIQPSYTNISGANVLGLYTSRALRSGYVTISPTTVNALIKSDLVSICRITGTAY